MSLVSRILQATNETENRIYQYENSNEWQKLVGYLDCIHKTLSAREMNSQLRASGMYFLCPRQHVWSSFFPLSHGVDLVSGLRMSLGTQLHHIVQNKILGPAQILEGEWQTKGHTTYFGMQDDLHDVYVEPQYHCPETLISGHGDGVIDIQVLSALTGGTFPIAGKVLFELKTVGSEGFEKLNSAKDIPDYYKMQAEIYQTLAKIDTTLFWFIERSTMDSKFFLYENTHEMWDTAREKAEAINEAIHERKLPTLRCSRPRSCFWCESSRTAEFREKIKCLTPSI